MPPPAEQFYDSDKDDEDEQDEVIVGEIGVCNFTHTRCVPSTHILQQLQIVNAELSAEVRTLKAAGASKSAKGGGGQLAIPVAEAVLHHDFWNNGKRFAALSELWVKASALKQPYPQHFRLLGL